MDEVKKKYLKTADLCKLFSISKGAVFNWRKEGMPYYGKEGPGNPKFYIESEVIKWLNSRDNNDKVNEVIESVYPVDK